MTNLRDYDRDATLIERVRDLERQLTTAQKVMDRMRQTQDFAYAKGLADGCVECNRQNEQLRESLDIAYFKGHEDGRACIPASVPESCKWALTDEDMWESDCGAAWTFVDGGPTENGMRFCLACGRVLEVVAPKPD